ncbi:MAG: AAA family ATPase [Coriobacteriales bacterium]|jgi:predicted AAA+ superfamily ATPase|nr:AAA family ATPase [Coriobacteriales bacterium]
MKRKIEGALLSWKKSPARKPLVLNGARQVGKTYSILKFAKAEYGNHAHIDFSAQKDIAALFAADITPDALVPQLRARLKTRLEPAETLLFFDEIQTCPRALTSLKYFCEQAPHWHIIAAGSLLGVALGREEYSYPVGKVDTAALHPMDFEEYLWARGEETLSQLIREAFDENRALGLHDRALRLMRDYWFCGGMPEVVRATSSQAAPAAEIRRLQGAIVEGFLADMTKYASPLDTAKLLNVWHGVPEQLAKKNHKFQYATIASSARAHQYEAPVNWLKAAGLVSLCHRITDALSPLGAFREQGFFKLYLLDTGILTGLYGAEQSDLEPSADKGSRFRGGIAENYVMQQLTAKGIDPFYWGTASKSEVDFVFGSKSGDIIPLEVKSGKNVTAKSLESYRNAYSPKYVIRCSTKNFGFENGIRSVPLYAASCIE